MLSPTTVTPQSQYHTPPSHLLVTGVALLVCVKAVLSLGLFPLLLGMLGDTYHAGNFPDLYDKFAENLVAGNGYRLSPETGPSMLREPGWPLVLAAMFAIFGKNLFAVQVLNVVMSFASAALTYDLGRRLLRSSLIGGLAASIVLFHPSVLVSESRGGVECLTMLLYTLCVWLVVQAFEKGQIWRFGLVGGVLGVAMITRSSVALLVPGLIFVWFLANQSKPLAFRMSLVRILITAATAALVMSPWIIRNFSVSGQFVPLMTNSGLAIFQGTYIVKHHTSGDRVMDVLDRAAHEQLRVANEMKLRHIPGFFPLFYSAQDELAFSRELTRRALSEYSESPGLLLKALSHNGIAFWIQGRTPRATLLNAVLTTPLLVLAAIGFWLGRRSLFAVSVLLVGVLALLVPHLFVIGLARYHMPVIPLLALLASISIAGTWRYIGRSNDTVKVAVR